MVGFLETGIIVADLKHGGMTAWFSEVLKMSVKTWASWSAHSLISRPGMLSGPVAFLVLTFLRTLHTALVSSPFIRVGCSFPRRVVVQSFKPSKEVI